LASSAFWLQPVVKARLLMVPVWMTEGSSLAWRWGYCLRSVPNLKSHAVPRLFQNSCTQAYNENVNSFSSLSPSIFCLSRFVSRYLFRFLSFCFTFLSVSLFVLFAALNFFFLFVYLIFISVHFCGASIARSVWGVGYEPDSWVIGDQFWSFHCGPRSPCSTTIVGSLSGNKAAEAWSRLITSIKFRHNVWPYHKNFMFSSFSIKVKLTNYARHHEGINPHFLDLCTSWRWVVSFTPLPLYPRGESPRYPLDRRLRGLQSRSGRRGEEKVLDPTGTRTPIPRSSS
jgi:hypothetical protein